MLPAVTQKNKKNKKDCIFLLVQAYSKPFFPLVEDAYKIRIRIDDEPANLDILDTAGQVFSLNMLVPLRVSKLEGRSAYVFTGSSPFNFHALCLRTAGNGHLCFLSEVTGEYVSSSGFISN